MTAPPRRASPVFVASRPGREGDRCALLSQGDGRGHWIARADREPPVRLRPSWPWADVVTRSPRFALTPDDVPGDLVDLATGRPAEPDRCLPPEGQCLRREAATALRRLVDAMRGAGFEGHVHSAFRSFDAQCAVFARWAERHPGGFCEATGGSALPGHSQHQLGTAVDLFTESWVAAGPAMRAGFGCDPGGRWLRANAWRYGWVRPYPEPEGAGGCVVSHAVDPRTGYQYEPWHFRYVGVAAAGALHAEESSGRGAVPDRWMREREGFDHDADLPLCDGCACGWCATFADARAPSPCPEAALRYGADGVLVEAARPPRLLSVEARSGPEGALLTVRVEVPPDTVTQTPVYVPGEAPSRSDRELPGAWRLAVDDGSGAWRWRYALVGRVPPGWVNGAPRRLPAQQGVARLTLAIPSRSPLRVTLRRGAPRGEGESAALREGSGWSSPVSTPTRW